jgi:hypothetical protein
MARKTSSKRRKQPPPAPSNDNSKNQDHEATHPPECRCFLRKQGLFLPPQMNTEEPKEETKA